jgi:hypothetical protein
VNVLCVSDAPAPGAEHRRSGCRITQIVEGINQIQRLVIARHLAGR